MELITQKIEILFEYRPTSFQEGPIEAIRTWGAVRWHGRHNIINFLICEQSHKIGEDLFIFEQVIQVKFHGQRVSLSHPSLEGLKQDRFFSSMIVDNLVVRIFKRTDAVSPITFSSDSLKKLGVLISKLNPTNGAAFSPVVFLILKEPQKVFFKNTAKISFGGSKLTAIFNVVQLQEGFVSILNGNR